MFCRECGNQLTDNTEICARCGVPTPLFMKNKLNNNLEEERQMRLLLPVGCPIQSLFAGYLGLFSVFPLVGILAAILGLSGLKAIRKKPEMAGRFRCWFGIIAGTISTLFYLCISIIQLVS